METFNPTAELAQRLAAVESNGIIGSLQEALPYLQRYSGKTVVVKYGGHAMDGGMDRFARDVVLLRQVGIWPVVVHGGGPLINATLERFGIRSEFVGGLRVTEPAAIEVIEAVLLLLNKKLVRAILAAGGNAVGFTGADAGLLTVEKLPPVAGRDLGFVGKPKAVDPKVLAVLEEQGVIPVIAPIGLGPDFQPYNVNADTVAGAIAAAAGAARLLMLTDVAGVMDKTGQLLSQLSIAAARGLLADGTASGGMIPKLETCIRAVEEGANGAVILDGRVPHAILYEIFTARGSGTLVTRA